MIDRVNDLNTDAPKVYVDVDKPVSPELIFGLDTKLFQLQGTGHDMHDDDHDHDHDHADHHENELDTMDIQCFSSKSGSQGYILANFEKFLGTLDKEDVYRLKGFVRLSGIKREDGTVVEKPTVCVVNHAFGKWTIIPVEERDEVRQKESSTSLESSEQGDSVLELHFILMGDLRMIENRIVHGCGAGYESGQVKCHYKARHHTVAWDSALPATLQEYVAQQAAKKQ